MPSESCVLVHKRDARIALTYNLLSFLLLVPIDNNADNRRGNENNGKKAASSPPITAAFGNLILPQLYRMSMQDENFLNVMKEVPF